jgi:hypothetical protein
VRLEVELFGLVLSVYLGPGVDIEDESEDESEHESQNERLYAADLSHSGWVPDPVFPTLDWGEDEDEQRTSSHVDLGHRRERQPDPPARGSKPFGFSGGR